jgi:hypothetical protein
MGVPHMAYTGDGLVDIRWRMVTLGDHLIDTMDINLGMRDGD